MNPANGAVLRVLDANANRAREALRVMEDYCRFVLDHDELSAELKQLRHDLASATRGWLTDAMLFRDTPGDVGTDNKTTAEFHREGIADVIMAAGKRLGESLRAIEEFGKIINPPDAESVERIRYRFYAIEQAVTHTLWKAKRFEPVRLYVLITERACRARWEDVTEQAIAGGADCLQLREKELESGELLRRAKVFVAICRRHGVLSIINDRADIALLSRADGVHLGQGDLSPGEARKIVGRESIVGVSTHNIQQARQAAADGADYIGVGPVFRSATKPRDFLPGLEFAAEAARQIKIPAVAIAGITTENVDEVSKAGITRIAVTAAVTGRDDVKSAAEGLKKKLLKGS